VPLPVISGSIIIALLMKADISNHSPDARQKAVC
jgi:hypothetical protein